MSSASPCATASKHWRCADRSLALRTPGIDAPADEVALIDRCGQVAMLADTSQSSCADDPAPDTFSLSVPSRTHPSSFFCASVAAVGDPAPTEVVTRGSFGSSAMIASYKSFGASGGAPALLILTVTKWRAPVDGATGCGDDEPSEASALVALERTNGEASFSSLRSGASARVSPSLPSDSAAIPRTVSLSSRSASSSAGTARLSPSLPRTSAACTFTL